MSRRSRSFGAPVSFFSFQDIITSVTGILILVTLLMALDLVVRADVRIARDSAPDPAPLRQAAAARGRQFDRLQVQVAETKQLLQRLGSISPVAAAEESAKLRAQLRMLSLDVENDRRATADTEEGNERRREQIATLRRAAADSRDRARRSSEHTQVLASSGKMVLLPGEGSKKRPIVIDCAGDRLRAWILNPDASSSELGDWESATAIDRLHALAVQRDPGTDYFVLFVRPDAVELHEELVKELKIAGFDVGWDAIAQDAKLFGEKR